MVRAPVRLPVALGLKVTPMVQLAPAARLLPQVLLLTRKSPLEVMLVMPSASVAAPVLLKVTVCGALVVPTFVDGNVSEVADSAGFVLNPAATRSNAPSTFSLPSPQFWLGVVPVKESAVALWRMKVRIWLAVSFGFICSINT